MNLYTELDNFLEPRASRIEEWQDLARMLISFLQYKGFTGPFSCTQPERTGIGSYMYVVEIGDGPELQWFAYDAEAGIADYLNVKPVPAEYS